MPVEIKELIVKVTVNNSHSLPTTSYQNSKELINKKELVKECVEKVMELLEMKSLR